METKILLDGLNLGYSMDHFINKKLSQLENVTLMETINDIILRRTLIKYIQKLHSSETELESIILLKRYIICQNILMNHDLFEDRDTFDKLIELSPSFLWEQKIKTLDNKGKKDLNFTYVMEKLKWETVIDLICHDDYKFFLMAIKKKSTLIRSILREIYKL